MPEREYVITEHFVAHQDIFVRASSKAEALAKVRDEGAGVIVMGDIRPSRPMSVHDVRVSRAALVCEVCGGNAAAGYLLGQARERARCGRHTQPTEQ